MISLSRTIFNIPMPVINDVTFYQPTVKEIMTMGERKFWGLVKIWNMSREELIEQENESSLALSTFELWKGSMMGFPFLKMQLQESVDLFLHTKVEFLYSSNTIIIGENDTSTLLDEKFYNIMHELIQSITSLDDNKEENEQYRETENMSEREKAILKKLKDRQEALNKIKNKEPNVEDRLAKQMISLVAIGNYTFEEVGNMTILQAIHLLRKHIEIQQYELYMSMSPWMDSKNRPEIEHWSNT